MRLPDGSVWVIGNCANAVSQALIAGGIDLSYGKDADYPGRIENPNGQYTFGGASQENIGLYLENYVEGELHAVKNVMTGTSGFIPNLAKGDVVIFEYTSGKPPPDIDVPIIVKRHVVMVEDVVDGVPVLAGDNPPSRGDNFYDKFFGESSDYKFDRAAFYHFQTAEETGQPVRFWGTDDFYGDEALQIAIYEAGHNFLGWILNNTDSSDQDMVVGEDTSDLEGCTYYIRAWCTDAREGIPDPEDAFTEPWTSDDPEHWAYWIRQAVIYGTENDYSDYDILSAVWYITDRSGWYNEILTSIDYPPDGPEKPTEDLQPPASPTSFTAIAGDEEVTLNWVNPSDSDFTGTLIRCRTDGTYPTGPTDGIFVISRVAVPGSTDSFIHKGLANGTTYYYTAFAYDEVSNYSEVNPSAQGSATPEDILAPGDITDFIATAGDGEVSLSWTNPTDSDFRGVKILRKTDSYPINPTDGIEIYNGTDTTTTDRGLTNGSTYYYTAFSYDEVPNYSSGSRASATPKAPYEGGGGGGLCFVATACYGSPLSKEVEILSRFRDEYLLTSPIGKFFVEGYYKISPPIARFINRYTFLKPIVRNLLKPIVWISKKKLNKS